MTKVAVVTTTVNVPENLWEWTRGLGPRDLVVVAGDRKTPHDAVVDLLRGLPTETVYTAPGRHAGTRGAELRVPHWDIESVVGVDSIQRRNVALLEAYARGADVVVTVDDDNWPSVQDETYPWMRHTADRLTRPNVERVLRSSDGWYDPGTQCNPWVTHRGFPLAARHATRVMTKRDPEDESVGVFAALWTGDPDVDAVERIVRAPHVSAVLGSVTLAPGTWAPFNSQATAVRGDLVPLMLMWPGVGRYDDIWASYLVRAVIDSRNVHVTYGHPVVEQRRNEHDVLADLRAELLGMERTGEVVAALRQVATQLGAEADAGREPAVIDALRFTFDVLLEELDWLPRQTGEAFDAWLSDVARAERLREEARRAS